MAEGSKDQLPATVTLDQAFRQLAKAYVELEAEPDAGLILFLQYLDSDPARWDDWKDALRSALAEGNAVQETTRAATDLG